MHSLLKRRECKEKAELVVDDMDILGCPENLPRVCERLLVGGELGVHRAMDQGTGDGKERHRAQASRLT